MFWKSLGVLVAMFAFSGSLMAQNEPFLGIWELKTEAQTQMIIATPAAGGGFTDIRLTIGKDNKASSENHPVVFDGKPYQTTGGDARLISYKRIDANTMERTQNRNGAITVDTETVSPDGKTLTIKQATGAPRVYTKLFNVQELGH